MTSRSVSPLDKARLNKLGFFARDSHPTLFNRRDKDWRQHFFICNKGQWVFNSGKADGFPVVSYDLNVVIEGYHNYYKRLYGG